MVVALIHKLAFSGVAAMAAAGAGLVTTASVTPAPAYGPAAVKLEAVAAASQATRLFDRADLDNDGSLGLDEYTIFAVVTAELARLNGFIPVDGGRGIETVAIARSAKPFVDDQDKAKIKERATREYRLIAGNDERLSADEFVNAQLEQFLAADVDRNGVLAGIELTSYASGQSRLSAVNS
jgi:hypothetical protein